MKKLLILLVAVSGILSACVVVPPKHVREYPRDHDRDGIPNRVDRDRDGDGVPNRYDKRPNNPNRY